jgi:hypothetical protein
MDYSSRATLEQVLRGIGPAGLSISTIGLGDPGQVGVSFEGLDEPALRGLAEQTGGLYESVNDPSLLAGIYERFGRTMQSEYAITYISPGSLRDGVNRSITVRLAGAAAGRAGYNPGGVIPEVPQGAGWMIFGVGLLALLALLLVPAGIVWVTRRMPARAAAKPGTSGRIRLRDEAQPTADRPSTRQAEMRTQTRIRLRS